MSELTKGMKHTSLYFDARSCPRHGGPMELILDDSRPNVSPLYWLCEQCRGSWAEEFFYFRAEQALPVLGLTESFSFPCPRCGSLEVSHACVVGCCDAHTCKICGAGFDLTAEVIDRHEPKVPQRSLDRALDQGSSIAVGGVSFAEHPFTLPSRQCGRHPTIALKFSSFDYNADERFRFGWSCSACSMVYHDYSLQRTQRPFFIPTSQPGIECPVCGGLHFDSQSDLNLARCTSCCSIVRLHAKEP